MSASVDLKVDHSVQNSVWCICDCFEHVLNNIASLVSFESLFHIELIGIKKFWNIPKDTVERDKQKTGALYAIIFIWGHPLTEFCLYWKNESWRSRSSHISARIIFSWLSASLAPSFLDLDTGQTWVWRNECQPFQTPSTAALKPPKYRHLD